MLRARLLALLYTRLIEPVQHLMRDADLLYLIPHGPLHYVPFEALRSPSGKYLLASDGPMLALAPSATILLRNCLHERPRQGEGCLALGYNDEGATRLQHAEAEAHAVARLMEGTAWTGPALKSQALLHEAPSVRWLHFAGHASFDPHDPLASALQLGAGDTLSARTVIAELALQAEVVTLSACTSGLSRVVFGDELLGLQRAFLYAGARTVVCTLWDAADVVTRLVMEHFYADLRRGCGPAAALRDAQVWLRELWGHEIAAIMERWRGEADTDLAALAKAKLELDTQPDSRPFAAPTYWAPFMLIGHP